jgi:serine/threonine protein kinase
LKPTTLYIDALHNPTLKIGGFGFARAFSLPAPHYTPEAGTLWYKPPEVLLGSRLYSLPWDVWSVGCILGVMATGSPVIRGDSEIDVLFAMFSKFGTPSEGVWPGVSDLPYFSPKFPKWQPRGWANIRNTLVKVGPTGIDLLEQLLCYDPQARISARRALAHPFFASSHPTEHSDCAAQAQEATETVVGDSARRSSKVKRDIFELAPEGVMIAASKAEEKTCQDNTPDDMWQEASEHQARAKTSASQAKPLQTRLAAQQLQAASGASCLDCNDGRGNPALEVTSAGGQSRKQRRQQRRRAWSLLFRVGQGSPALE